MDSKKIMEQLMEGVSKNSPQAAANDDVKTAVAELANMVVLYNAELKSRGVGYFFRRSLLIAFQTQTLGTALIMHSCAAGSN